MRQQPARKTTAALAFGASARRAQRGGFVRRTLHFVVAKGIAVTLALFGLVAGIVLGPLFGALAALGLCPSTGVFNLVPGPGAWVARQVRRRSRNRLANVPGAVVAGGLAGLVTGPVWFDFLGWNLGKFVGEALACRLIDAE